MGYYIGSALADYLYKQRRLNVTSSAMANFEIYGTSHPTVEKTEEKTATITIGNRTEHVKFNGTRAVCTKV